MELINNRPGRTKGSEQQIEATKVVDHGVLKDSVIEDQGREISQDLVVAAAQKALRDGADKVRLSFTTGKNYPCLPSVPHIVFAHDGTMFAQRP